MTMASRAVIVTLMTEARIIVMELEGCCAVVGSDSVDAAVVIPAQDIFTGL